ncbi:MAG: transposase family protein [Clostridia bacterium]|nr:transposase family protein [Clostridia bacterium]
MTRREKRNLKKEINIFSDVANIIKQYFPKLIEILEKLTDTRHQSYVEYKMSVITVTRLLGLLCGIKSMRETTEKFNTEQTIKNIANVLEIKLEEIPHYDTINKVFEKLEIEELRKIQKYIVNRLIRSKMFDKYRFKDKYFQIVIDGTGIMSFQKRHCKHCLRSIYNKGEENEYSVYYHYVLEAKLVVGDIVISIDSEFVENEDENVEKQDCEIRAFYRMAERIKKEHPRLPIIISGDALYACEPVMKVCREKGWQYILRLKRERLRLLGEEINCVEKAERKETSIKYWNDLKYGEVRIEKQANVLKYYEEKEDTVREFLWITSFKITEKNKEELVYFGRQRWKIENEGFNMQKNGTFDIEHIYSMNYNAMKSHYFFIQFAHTIRQLLEKGIKYIIELKMGKKEVSAALTQALTQNITNLTEHKKTQLRFDPG